MAYLQRQTRTSIQTEVFIAKLMQNQKRGNQKQNHCKVRRNLKKPWQKSEQLSFIPGWTSGEIPQRWWLVLMIGDENGDDSMSVSPYSQKYTWLLLKTVTDKLMLMDRRSWLSLDYPPRLQPIQSDYLITIPMPYHMGGCHRKGGGFSGLNAKPDTEGQNVLNCSVYQSGLQNKISGWMRWITCERAYQAIENGFSFLYLFLFRVFEAHSELWRRNHGGGGAATYQKVL